MGGGRGAEIFRDFDTESAEGGGGGGGKAPRGAIGCGNRAALGERLLSREDRAGEIDQRRFDSVLNRARDAIFRVSEEAGRFFDGGREGAIAGCAFPADGGGRRGERSGESGDWSAGERHRGNGRAGRVSCGRTRAAAAGKFARFARSGDGWGDRICGRGGPRANAAAGGRGADRPDAFRDVAGAVRSQRRSVRTLKVGEGGRIWERSTDEGNRMDGQTRGGLVARDCRGGGSGVAGKFGAIRAMGGGSARRQEPSSSDVAEVRERRIRRGDGDSGSSGGTRLRKNAGRAAGASGN